MKNQQEKDNLSLFCIVAPDDEDDAYYQLFKSHLRTALKNCPIYESSRVNPGENVSEEQQRLSLEATCCLAITSAEFYNTEACTKLLASKEVQDKLLEIKLRPFPDVDHPAFKDRASLPRRGQTIHTSKQNKEELCKEIAQEVKKFLLARTTTKPIFPSTQEKVSILPLQPTPSIGIQTKPLTSVPLTPIPDQTYSASLASTPVPPFPKAAGKKKILINLVRVAFCLVLLATGWLLHSFADDQAWFATPPSLKTFTINTLADAGAGSLRQELSEIPLGQSAILIFGANLQGNTQGLQLKSPLIIDRNVTIEATDVNPISAQILSQQQITITANSPEVTITIAAGNTVSFRNIQFRGIYGIKDINNFDYAAVKNPQPSAFLQVSEAQVDLLNCEMSSFYSDTDGSALSNLYGDVRPVLL